MRLRLSKAGRSELAAGVRGIDSVFGCRYDSIVSNDLLGDVERVKKSDPKIARALEVFLRTQEVYEKALAATTWRRSERSSGTYSSSMSEKDYRADISTVTQ
jgi:hypothetical protein